MATVTPAMIKELRESSGAGMLDCKKALSASGGDMQGAIEWLRKKGLSKVSKVSNKIAAEGVVDIQISDNFQKATLTEINCQTDFVAKNDNFLSIANEMGGYIHTSSIESIEELKTFDFNGQTYEEKMASAIQKVGEKVDVRRFYSLSVGENGIVNGYIHGGGKIGVIVAIECDSSATATALKDMAKDVAMHIAAMNPAYLNEDEIPSEVLEKEKELAIEDLKKQGKPEAMFDKIIPGKLKKYAKENTLVNQPFVKDDKKNVAQAVSEVAKKVGGKAEIVAFKRFSVGEGIEKKEVSFADEVAAQLGSTKA
jgi:elongation factor Ts